MFAKKREEHSFQKSLAQTSDDYGLIGHPARWQDCIPQHFRSMLPLEACMKIYDLRLIWPIYMLRLGEAAGNEKANLLQNVKGNECYQSIAVAYRWYPSFPSISLKGSFAMALCGTNFHFHKRACVILSLEESFHFQAIVCRDEFAMSFGIKGNFWGKEECDIGALF